MLFKTPYAQKHICYLLAVDTSPGAGPKPFTRNLPGKAGRKALPLPPMGMNSIQQCHPSLCACMLTTALSSATLQPLLEVVLLCKVWQAQSHGESRGDEWNVPTVLNGCISLPHLYRCIRLQTQGGPRHITTLLAPRAKFPSRWERREGGV